MPSITRQEVEGLLNETLGYFEGGLGSGNKMYADPDAADYKLEHNKRAERAETAMRVLDRPEVRTLDGLALGDYLRDNNVRVGNCGPMTGVAASLLNDHPNCSSLKEKARFVHTAGAGDHEFLVISDRVDISAGELPSIRDDFGKAEFCGTWVVDPWMGVACRLGEYQQRVEQTLDGWERDNLVVATASNVIDDVPFPTAQDETFREDMLDATVELYDVELTQVQQQAGPPIPPPSQAYGQPYSQHAMPPLPHGSYLGPQLSGPGMFPPTGTGMFPPSGMPPMPPGMRTSLAPGMIPPGMIPPGMQPPGMLPPPGMSPSSGMPGRPMRGRAPSAQGGPHSSSGLRPRLPGMSQPFDPYQQSPNMPPTAPYQSYPQYQPPSMPMQQMMGGGVGMPPLVGGPPPMMYAPLPPPPIPSQQGAMPPPSQGYATPSTSTARTRTAAERSSGSSSSDNDAHRSKLTKGEDGGQKRSKKKKR